MLRSFFQHFVLVSGFCSAGLETLGGKGGMTPSFSRTLMPVTPLVLYSLRGNSENSAVTSCHTWKGKALHVTSLSCKPSVQAATVKP